MLNSSGFYSVLLISLVLIANVICDQGAIDLARLGAQLDRIEAKLDKLNKTVTSCGCSRSVRFSRQTSEQRSHNSPVGSDVRSILNEHGERNDHARLVQFNRFNRLADNLNSIAPDGVGIHIESGKGQADGESARNEQLVGNPVASNENQLMMNLEALLGDAFDNLNLIMREQLVGFKLTLNKLIGILSDHNFQHVSLSNQLNSVQDECSIAASQVNSMSSSTIMQQDPSKTGSVSCAENATTNTLRSSDAIMMARLISDNLENLIRKSVSLSLSDQQQQNQRPSSTCPTDQLREQEEHLRLETTISRGLGGFQRRLDEIYSVLKQAANNVNSLRLSQTALMDQQQSQQTTTTIVYTNDQQANQSSVASRPIGRWYAGSKVPNQRPSPILANMSEVGNNQSSKLHWRPEPTAGKCQVETNLKRPRSCQELQAAGANCTGQYYIFVRGVFTRVYCEMTSSDLDAGEGQGAGGWTVVLRRLDKSLDRRQASEQNVSVSRTSWLDQIKSAQMDFDQDWQAYRSGFGTYEDWSEFFMGLDLLHQLTNQNESTTSMNELQLDLQANDTAELHLKFDNFSIGPESDQFRLTVGACNLTERPELCSPMVRLNMSTFMVSPTGGWWQPQDEKGSEGLANLTDPIGKPDRHLYWPGWSEPAGASRRALRRVVMKVRSRRLAASPRKSRMTAEGAN